MTKASIAFACVLAGAAFTAPGRAECDFVWRAASRIPGVDDTVGKVFAWDHDAEPDTPEQIVVSGWFSLAGDQNVPGLALWDGANWNSLGSESIIGGLGFHDFIVHDGALLAVGDMSLRNGTSFEHTTVARWNGAAWQSLGFFGEGFCVTKYNDRLVIGGRVRPSAGGSFIGIVEQIGSEWMAVGGGASGVVNDMVIHQGELVAVGSFRHIAGQPVGGVASWNGSAWRVLAQSEGLSPPDKTCTTSDGTLLYVAGDFETIDGVNARFVASWDGKQWAQIGPGITVHPPGYQFGTIEDMHTYQGDLYVSGAFHDAAGIPEADKIVRWDGKVWSALDQGMNLSVNSMTVAGGSLVVGGQFTLVSGLTLEHVAQWKNGEWQALSTGMSGSVRAITSHNGALYAGGLFQINGRADDLGLAIQEAGVWNVVGNTSAVGAGDVYHLASYGPFLIVDGEFDALNGAAMRDLAAWDGQQWLDLGQPSGVDAMTVFRDELVVGSQSLTVGGSQTRGFAAWNGTAWRQLGQQFSNAAVTTLAVHNDVLISSGSFSPVGGAGANLIRFDDSTWVRMATVQGGSIAATAEYDGKLILAGTLNSIDGVPAPDIIQWDGAHWSALGPGFATSHDFKTLAVYNGELVAGGSFNSPQSPSRVWAWNGHQWRSLDVTLSGFNDVVRTLAVHDDELFLGGFFTHVSGVPAPYVARYSLTSGDAADCNANGVFDVCDLVPGGGSDDNNDDGVPDECQSFTTGDMNCNGVVNVADIAGFVLALTDPAGYAAQFPSCDVLNGDCNGNGVVNVADIGAFVQLLTGR